METRIKRENARNFKASFQQDIVKSSTCNCKDKSKCPADGVCKMEEVAYKTERMKIDQSKVYAVCTEGSFKRHDTTTGYHTD